MTSGGRKGDFSRCVIFDTNVVEARYMAPLLRGEPCRDLALLRAATPAYTPAIYIKSFYEICQHAKEARNFPWLKPEWGYPGGLDVGRRLLAQLPHLSPDNVSWWFGLCDEWQEWDWEGRRDLVCRTFGPENREEAPRELSVRKKFAEWKGAVTAFCDRCWTALGSAFTLINRADGYVNHQRLFELEQTLAGQALIPSEDFEIVSGALGIGAAALVTNDRKLRNLVGLSLDLNNGTAFVHADQPGEAVAEEFASRWFGQETDDGG